MHSITMRIELPIVVVIAVPRIGGNKHGTFGIGSGRKESSKHVNAKLLIEKNHEVNNTCFAG